jgi:hypothetical protein
MNLTVVACPWSDTPCRVTITQSARSRMRTSSHWLRWSTYQTSSSSLSSHGPSMRPLIGAQPVMPGRTSCAARLLRAVALQVLDQHGPRATSDNSPTSTLSISGSSPSDVERRNRPKSMGRCPSGNRSPSGRRSLVIVRNLRSSTSSPSRPGRCWRNSTGGPNSRLTATPAPRTLARIAPARSRSARCRWLAWAGRRHRGRHARLTPPDAQARRPRCARPGRHG